MRGRLMSRHGFQNAKRTPGYFANLSNAMSYFAAPPSSAFGTFSPRKARGEKALDWKALQRRRTRCSRKAQAGEKCGVAAFHTLAGNLNRAPSPPRFSVGEKVAEGRMRGPLMSRHGFQNAKHTPGYFANLSNNAMSYFAAPPSSAFGTFSPRKAWGEKALDWKASTKRCEKCR